MLMNEAPSPDTQSRPPVSPGTRTRVLVVEDEADIAGLIKHALERNGACGGLALWAAAGRTAANRRPMARRRVRMDVPPS